MSPNVGNFVHDLVEMAKAMEELPKVQDQLADANRRADALAKTVASRETSILSLKAEIEVLNHKLNAAEVARDDAEYRFLELDEKAAGAVNLVRAMQATLGQVTEKLDPPKPQPAQEPKVEVQAQPEAIQSQGQSETTPMEPSSQALGTPTDQSMSAEGQSDPLPTSSASTEPNASTSSADQERSASPSTASHTEAKDTKPSGPYTGRLYYDHPTYVPLSEWLAGGGTDDDYNWRPQPIRQPSF